MRNLDFIFILQRIIDSCKFQAASLPICSRNHTKPRQSLPSIGPPPMSCFVLLSIHDPAHLPWRLNILKLPVGTSRLSWFLSVLRGPRKKYKDSDSYTQSSSAVDV